MNSVQNVSDCYALKANQRNAMVNISPTNPALNPSPRPPSLIYLQKTRALAIVNYSSPTVCYSSNYSTTKTLICYTKNYGTLIYNGKRWKTTCTRRFIIELLMKSMVLDQNVCTIPKTVR